MALKNGTKVKKLGGKIASVCEAIQFNNKWKSIDLKIAV